MGIKKQKENKARKVKPTETIETSPEALPPLFRFRHLKKKSCICNCSVQQRKDFDNTLRVLSQIP